MNKKTNDSSKRNLVKSIKLSPEELKEFEAAAAEKGLDFSTYMRESARIGNMPEDYYEKKYLCRLINITEGINKINEILNSPEPNIDELRKIAYSMDKEIITTWRY